MINATITFILLSVFKEKRKDVYKRQRESRSTMYNNIIREINNGNKVVAVVSAMGRYDDPYATDTLLSIVNTQQLTDEEIDRLTSIGAVSYTHLDVYKRQICGVFVCIYSSMY